MKKPIQLFLSRPKLFAFSLIVVVGLFLFGKTLSYPFIYDDQWTIVRNEALNAVSPVSRFFKDPKTTAYPPSGIGLDVYRPLATLSFAVNKKLNGLSPPAFRLVNFLLHFLNAFFLFILLRRILDFFPALCAALLFLVHPLQVESVVWITQRSILLCGFFLLAGSLLHVNREKGPGWQWGSVALFLLAFLSKEAALVFPFVLLAGYAAVRKNPGKEVWAMAALSPFLFLIRQAVLGRPFQGVSGVGFPERIKDGLTALALYAENLVWPVNLSPSYPAPDFGEISLEFWFGLVLLFTLIAGAVILWKRKSPWALVPLVFLAFWAPHSGLVPTVTYAADRFLYLPLIGLAAGFGALVQKSPFKRGSIAVLVCFSILTIQQAGIWASDVILWTTTVDNQPDRPFPRAALGESLYKAGRKDEAIQQLEKSLSLGPRRGLDRSVSILLSRMYREAGNDHAAEQVLREASERFRPPLEQAQNQ